MAPLCLLSVLSLFLTKLWGNEIRPTKSGKGSKAMLLTDVGGTPLGVMVTSARPHEVKLIEPLLNQSQIPLRRRFTFLYDRAVDSQSLREGLQEYGVRLISPFRKRRDGTQKKLSKTEKKKYSHRCKVKRTVGWLKNYWRHETRWGYYAHLHEAFWNLYYVHCILRGF